MSCRHTGLGKSFFYPTLESLCSSISNSRFKIQVDSSIEALYQIWMEEQSSLHLLVIWNEDPYVKKVDYYFFGTRPFLENYDKNVTRFMKDGIMTRIVTMIVAWIQMICIKSENMSQDIFNIFQESEFKVPSNTVFV